MALARSIHECGLRRKRELEATSKIIRDAFYLNALLAVLAIVLMVGLDFLHVDVGTQWLMLLTVLFGALGGLLSGTLQLKNCGSAGDDVKTERAKLLFGACLGAVAAVVVALFLRLRIVDFPLLHSSTSEAPVAPAASYVFAFASGLTVQALFKTSPKQVGAAASAQAERQLQDPDKPAVGQTVNASELQARTSFMS